MKYLLILCLFLNGCAVIGPVLAHTGQSLSNSAAHQQNQREHCIPAYDGQGGYYCQ